MRKIAVGDIMTRNFLFVLPTANLFECARIIVKSRVDSLLIVNNHKLLGIITARDILWAITRKPSLSLKSINVMLIATKKVAVIKPSADITQALNKMKSLNFRRLPVISKGKLIGILTLKDILRVDPSLYSESGELTKVREEQEKFKNLKNGYIEDYCENCGNFGQLKETDGSYICAECREEY